MFLLIRGKNQKLRAGMDFLFKNRTRFISCATILVVLDYVVSASIWNKLMPRAQFHIDHPLFFFRYDAVALFCFVAITAWLMPAQNRRAREIT
jgi:hypothetical protein